ncbi:MAG: hypothetical protein NVSMB53_19630 [Gemmatimonadaceae bacterium]
MSSLVPDGNLGIKPNNRRANALPPCKEIPKKWRGGVPLEFLRAIAVDRRSPIFLTVALQSPAFAQSGSKGMRISVIPLAPAALRTGGVNAG